MSDVYFKASLQNTLYPEVGTFDNVGNKEGTFTLEDGEYYLTNNTDTSYRVYYPTKDITYSVGFTTIEFDVYYDKSYSFMIQCCLAFNIDDENWYGFGVSDSTLYFTGGRGLPNYEIATSPSTWLHVKCIFDYNPDQSIVHIYVDNVEVNKFTISNNYDIKYIDILGNNDSLVPLVPDAKIKNIIIYGSKKHYLDTIGLTSLWSKIKSIFATKTELANKANDSDVVHKSGDETIDGTKTFSAAIVGSVTGNAGSATKLATARTINGTSFDGTANITTANWGTARNIAIADATAANTGEAVSVNGSAAVTLKLPAAIKANVTGSLTGNAASATKLAAKRTIALSGAATGTATKFDGSGNITIPVTALAASAICAQWYAAYPDGAEAHNAMWGGRDISAAFDSGEFSEHIADGTFKDIFPGDYITKQVTIPQVLADDGTTVLFAGGTYTVNWVIADCDYWINKGDSNMSMTTHHVAIVPQQMIFKAHMNSTNTTEGGYAGSEMYKNIIPACATGIVSAFGSDHILTFRDAISNSVDTSYVSSGLPQFTGTPGWFGVWVSVQCNLMSEKMVYGAPICSGGAMDNTMATRQMSAFRLSERLINYRQAWWLRDVVSSTTFASVAGAGNARADGVSGVIGVRPFALLV